jgi:hypothetical protein
MKCPQCQSELPDNAKFCNRCGKSLQAELICSSCQHPNPWDSRFCLQCGQSLVPVQASPPAPIPSSVPTSFANGGYQVKNFPEVKDALGAQKIADANEKTAEANKRTEAAKLGMTADQFTQAQTDLRDQKAAADLWDSDHEKRDRLWKTTEANALQRINDKKFENDTKETTLRDIASQLRQREAAVKVGQDGLNAVRRKALEDDEFRSKKSEVLRRNLLLVRNAVTWIANALGDGDDYRRLAKEIEPLNKLPSGAAITDENADEVIAALAHAVSDAYQIVARFSALKKPTRLQESITEELRAYFDFVAGNSMTGVPQNELFPFVKPAGWVANENPSA